ncbi:MAG: amidohydrolase family protein [Chloroflexi bacterium]|nr:amidohydrolase family protein [Chloroflexota bacterium]
MDIAIVNTWLITMRGGNLGIVEDGALGIDDGKISYVGPTQGFEYANAGRVIDGSNHVTMPGLVNVHFHSTMTLLRGGAQDVPEIEWMNRAVGPLSRHVTEDDQIVGSKLAVIEGLRSGTTTFAEYTGNVGRLVENVYLPFGARVVATETINEVVRDRAHLKPTDLYTFDPSIGETALQRAEDLFDKFQGEKLVKCMYGPHALDMMSMDLLKAVTDRAIKRGCGMQMHVAQGGRERLQIVGRYGEGMSTVKALHEHGLLGDFLIGSHCHDTDEAERELMAEAGVKMASCQSSISMIDGIVPPLAHYLDLGGQAGLGTDQAPGPGNHNMVREMRTASLLAKITYKDPTKLPAWKALELATIGGARVVGLDDKIGSLEVGKMADLITIDLNHPNLTPVVSRPFHNFVPNLVYSASGDEVDNVIIGGRLVMDKGRFPRIDEAAVMAEANTRARRILEDAEEDWRKAGSALVKSVDAGWL